MDYKEHYEETLEKIKPLWDWFEGEQEYNSEHGYEKQYDELLKIQEELSDYIISHP